MAINRYLAWLEKNGFNKEGVTYCICGENTFNIKELLKEKGCKFSSLLKWHSAEHIELPEGYYLAKVAFNDVYYWDLTFKMSYETRDANKRLNEIISAVLPKKEEKPSEFALSEYVGEIGERLRDLEATVVAIKGFSGPYGYSFVYSFNVEGNLLTWFTTKEYTLEAGDSLLLTGTVKKQEEYKGVKTTYLNRCILKNS